MVVERRKHHRVLTQNNAFAALGSDYSKVGKIKNISSGGLAFEYIVGEESQMQSNQVDIFLTGKVFHLYNVPCRLIYDIEVHIPHVNNHFVKMLTTKRCGLQFEKLTEEEKNQLMQLIDSANIAFY